MTDGYTAYVLNAKERDALLAVFEPEFSSVYAHHITNEFNVRADHPIADLNKIEITHHISDGHGLECLVLRVNGQEKTPRDLYFHITWSLDSDASPMPYITMREPDSASYKPRHSHYLIEAAFSDDKPDYITVRELGCRMPPKSFTAQFIPTPQ